MNQRDVQLLLGAAAAIDQTVPAPGRQVIEMWAAILDDVPAEAGQSAVRAYYRSSAYAEHKRTITPSDIYDHWRQQHRLELERRHQAELVDQRRALEAAPGPVRSLAEEFAVQQAHRRGEDAQSASEAAKDRSQVLGVRCPHCRSVPGVACVRYGGRPLRWPHPARFEEAGVVYTPANPLPGEQTRTYGGQATIQRQEATQ